MQKNKFIVVEGIDGAGKTTLTSELEKRLGENCALFREPTSESPYSGLIREILSGKKDYNELEIRKLFLEDRLWNITTNLKPSFEKKVVTILDRYYFSTAAYQGRDPDDVDSIIDFYQGSLEIPQPDQVFYLRVDIDTALSRILERNQERDIFEKKSRLEKILGNYDRIFTSIELESPVIILDAKANPIDIADFVISKISLIE